MKHSLFPSVFLSVMLFPSTLLWGQMAGEGEFSFDVNDDDVPEMTLSDNGLGIGTSSPSANLHVMGNAIYTGHVVIGGTTNDSSSNLHVHGSMAYSIQSVSAGSHEISNTSLVLADTSSGNVTLQLPDASTYANQVITIKRSSDLYTLYLAGGGNTIDGYTTMSFPSGNNTSITLVNNGTSWYILDLSFDETVLDEIAVDNLVLWWKLDESSGNIVTDDSSAGNLSGNLTNQHSFTGNSVSGVLGAALQLDNSDDTVLHEASSNLSYTSYTYSLWAKYTANSSDTVEIEPEISGRAGFVWASGNQFYHMAAYHQLADQTYVSTNIQSTATLSANAWYHFAVTWDNASDNLSLYLNGNLESGNVAATWMSGTNIVLTNPGSFNDGVVHIDDLRFFDTAVRPGEIQTLYYSGNP